VRKTVSDKVTIKCISKPEDIDLSYDKKIAVLCAALKDLIDSNRTRNADKPYRIEYYSKNYRDIPRGSIRIIHGGEAIRFSYEGDNLSGITYNDHIFHKDKGSWEDADRRYKGFSMKVSLRDVYTMLRKDKTLNLDNLSDIRSGLKKEKKDVLER
jgi:hypothetical protein